MNEPSNLINSRCQLKRPKVQSQSAMTRGEVAPPLDADQPEAPAVGPVAVNMNRPARGQQEKRAGEIKFKRSSKCRCFSTENDVIPESILKYRCHRDRHRSHFWSSHHRHHAILPTTTCYRRRRRCRYRYWSQHRWRRGRPLLSLANQEARPQPRRTSGQLHFQQVRHPPHRPGFQLAGLDHEPKRRWSPFPPGRGRMRFVHERVVERFGSQSPHERLWGWFPSCYCCHRRRGCPGAIPVVQCW